MMVTFTEKRFFKWVKDEVSVSLRNKSGSYGGGSEVFVIEPIEIRGEERMKVWCIGNGQLDQLHLQDNVGALNCMHEQQAVITTPGTDEISKPIDAHYYKGPGERNGEERQIVANNSGTRVRRLTPMECERLQSFPDGWTDIGEWTDTKGKKHKPADSPRYKALGNSIAVVAWIDILQEIAKRCPEGEKTLGSLFAGIGGFDLIWERLCGGKSVWSSEIEEFCVAVLKKHFGDEG